MSAWLWIALGAIGAVAVGMVVLRRPNAKAAMVTAIQGDLGPLVTKIESDGTDDGTGWDNALTELWRTYHRQTAALLVVEAAARSDADIIQYWIGQVIQVEPEIARETFTQEFLETHFNPDVASRCGRKGCC